MRGRASGARRLTGAACVQVKSVTPGSATVGHDDGCTTGDEHQANAGDDREHLAIGTGQRQVRITLLGVREVEPDGCGCLSGLHCDLVDGVVEDVAGRCLGLLDPVFWVVSSLLPTHRVIEAVPSAFVVSLPTDLVAAASE